jgi:dTDP-4-amino-4,6-dideoxygalactose transaminase
MSQPVRAKEDFLVFAAPQIEQPEMDEVLACLRTGWLGTGPRTARFEREFAAYKGAENSVAFNSCTAALHTSLLAAGLEPGDEVITTPLTFCASVNAIIHSGATPVLADIDLGTMNIDPEQIRRRITPRTKAILPVHFAGRPAEMDEIMGIATQYGLTVIEDCAHAIETEYHGRKAGTFGEFGCFSFYVTKNVITGEGGMVLTHKAGAAERLKVLALHGMSKDAWKRFSDDGYKHYQVTDCGFKYNMMDLQAAIGIHQLARVEDNWRRREQIWGRYQEALAELPITLPAAPATNTRHAYHLFTIRVDGQRTGVERDAFLDGMTRHHIGVGVHYMSIPEHPFYQDRFGWSPEDWPNAMLVGRQTVSLPLSPKLSNDDVDDVIEATRRVLNG